MKKVYKYIVPIGLNDFVAVPASARFLMVAFQHEDLCVWAEVDVSEEQPVKTKMLTTVLTGNDVSDGFSHVGSAQAAWGTSHFVAHVYEADSVSMVLSRGRNG